jgi:hypothetical protein
LNLVVLLLLQQAASHEARLAHLLAPLRDVPGCAHCESGQVKLGYSCHTCLIFLRERFADPFEKWIRRLEQRNMATLPYEATPAW